MTNLEIFGIPYFKGGSGIHIKKLNRGKFTDYCNGKVTNECILRGKNSSDPKIRKRATFALNARAWKHLLGGAMKCQNGTPRGGLIPKQYSGTWGNRGLGNELLSALENGLSWVGDKVMNFGDYVEDGLAYIVGSIPGGKFNAEQTVKNSRLARQAKNNGDFGYTDVSGDFHVFPVTGVVPSVGIKLTPQDVKSKWNSFKQAVNNMDKNKFDAFFKQLTDQQWDDIYNNAVKENNVELLLKIRDSHFRVKAPKSETHDYWYHSTNKNFNTFDMDAKGSFTTEPLKHVGTERAAQDVGGKITHKLFLNLENSIKTYDGAHESYIDLANELYRQGKISLEELNKFRTRIKNGNQEIRKLMLSKKIDGTRYTNESEDIGSISRAFIKPSLVKKADPITRDDLGNIIPISKRDNFNIDDFRYSWTIPILGTSTILGTMLNNFDKE